MSEPAIVKGDIISGTCPNHMIPAESGTKPAGPLPFAAPLTQGLAESVTIGGKPAAVVGSFGYNSSPHVGIVDGPFASPQAQIGRVVGASATVYFEGKPAAKSTPPPTMCVIPGTIVGSAANVMING
ncbi:MAG: PAAR domain-containing protein [Acidimicrobiia bacterium]